MIIYACTLALGRIYNLPLFRFTFKIKTYLDKLPWRVHKLTNLLERVVLNIISTWRLRGGFSIHGYSVITENSVPPKEQSELFIFLSLKHWEVESYRKWHLHISHHIIFMSVNWSCYVFSIFFQNYGRDRNGTGS